MISTHKLLYKLDLRLNKVDTLQHQSIPNEDKVLALNQAQIQLVKKKLNTNNLLGVGMDGFKKRYEDLQTLVVHSEKLEVEKTSEIYSSYKADLSKLSQKYFLPLDIYCLCSKGDCTDRVVVINKIVKHGDLNVLLNNSNYSPSFEYQETLAVISDNKLYAYTDGNFKVDNVYITYLKYPKDIDIEGYINFNNESTETVDCELPEILEDELLNLAELELAIDTENVNVVNANNIRNNNNE